MSHRDRAINGLRVVPVTHAQANAFVAALHRHNGRLPTSIVRAGVADAQGHVRGVAIAGLPKGIGLVDGYTLEVSRVCTDGAYNACSMLYAACIRAGRALGYLRFVTYTLQAEIGASLRAAGWTQEALLAGRSWKERHGDAYEDRHDTTDKARWVIRFPGDMTDLRWPQSPGTQHPSLFDVAGAL